MEMYHFQTVWHVRAPVERVWQSVTDAERWTEWGKGFRSVRVLGGETRLNAGATAFAEIRGALPYTLSFHFTVKRFEPPTVLSIQPAGDIVGEGRWEIASTPDGATATFYWDVGLTNRFLDALSRLPLAKKVLAWNHDYVMRDAYHGFRRQTELKST